MSRTAAAAWSGVTYTCDIDEVDPTVLANATSIAQAWLFTLSGGRVGQFTTVDDEYRPNDQVACGLPYRDERRGWLHGRFDDEGGARCCEITLHRQPVASIDEVRLYGVAMASSEYRLEGSTLRRVNACWPADEVCDPPPVSVDYTWGVTPDATALAAAGELACEMIRALTGDRDCRLPQAATQIVRQGVSVTKSQLDVLIKNGLTGLPIVDAFIRQVNPNRLTQRSRVINIDGPRRAV